MFDTETGHYTTTRKQGPRTEYPPLPAKMTIASSLTRTYPCLLLFVPPSKKNLKLPYAVTKLLQLLSSIKSRIKPLKLDPKLVCASAYPTQTPP